MITESEARQLDMTPKEHQAYLAGEVITYLGLFLLGRNKVHDLLRAKEKLDDLIGLTVQEQINYGGTV